VGALIWINVDEAFWNIVLKCGRFSVAPHMRFHNIQYVLAVCETGNISRAAKRCGVSQPSVSSAIKKFESTLGGPLFFRKGGRTNQERNQVQLTKLGAAVLPYLKQIDKCARDIERNVTEIDAGVSIISAEQKGVRGRFKPQLNAQRVQIAENALNEVMTRVPLRYQTPEIIISFFCLILNAAAHGRSGEEELVAVAIEQMQAISALFM
jgi:molybdenum-dependent DNA-binding transcriptional regulator ModE